MGIGVQTMTSFNLRRWNFLNVLTERFNSSEINFLEAAITNEEIKRALFDMAPLKAPGSDGFHAHFFQSQWDILGNDVCQWVKDVFAGRPIEPDLNNTLIVLIPKKKIPRILVILGPSVYALFFTSW
ncbi:tyrosine decarboxylase 1-like [Gossypium australe]|uniref:Tyrosine decarboxylase 1-like n=1 Tax=Gossypium australe TaxID=47621 RepID=A0A5B6WVA2_9ROSI|nr:tyrosine decarboxylase 1-like [Gossypium australe]